MLFLQSFQDSAEMPGLYEMGDAGEGGLECFLSGKMVKGQSQSLCTRIAGQHAHFANGHKI